MRCEDVKEWLLLGEREWRTEAQGEAVDAHLSACASCRRERDRAEALRASLEAWTLAPAPPGDLSVLREAEAASRVRVIADAGPGAPWIVRRGALLLGTLAAAACLFAVVLLHRTQRDTERALAGVCRELANERSERETLAASLESRLRGLDRSLAALDEAHETDLVLLARAVDESVREAVRNLRVGGRRSTTLDDPSLVSLLDRR